MGCTTSKASCSQTTDTTSGIPKVGDTSPLKGAQIGTQPLAAPPYIPPGPPTSEELVDTPSEKSVALGQSGVSDPSTATQPSPAEQVASDSNAEQRGEPESVQSTSALHDTPTEVASGSGTRMRSIALTRTFIQMHPECYLFHKYARNVHVSFDIRCSTQRITLIDI